ncbi:hypothetical protein KDH_35390 [Dictyobacter sp. S3.2.2.5]|uniref:Uncharacterized protein n=1 Tax=Dictyobacter halimunensis TaxID=3026934 RepID=A0ABQ6FTU9_9CHLR|nr:hypothetical protein KDH_35390 [Dictyobacter sp. S3.2.2.5]
MPKRHQQSIAKSATGNNNPTKTTEHTHEHSELDLTHKADSQRQEEDPARRSGSDSNASNHRKGTHLHHDAIEEPAGKPPEGPDFNQDLESDNRAGENHGMRDPNVMDRSRSAYDIKELHQILADLTADEMKTIFLVAPGKQLEQGAKYIDLKHLERGEFTATASMQAEPDHYYVPKKETDYVLWNRLNQVDNPVRMDELENSEG